MQTRLVMIEGVPFTGKSTSSEFVTQQLGLNGHPARWIYEGVMLHEYFTHVLAVLERKQTIDEDLLRADWERFVRAVEASDEILVVDAAISFAAVNPLLAVERPRTAILDYLKQLAELCAPLQPRVIHLVGDIARLAPASIVERGVQWEEHMVGQAESFPYQQARGRSGVDGAIAFMQDGQEMVSSVLKEGGWQHITLDVSATDWATNRRAMLHFLQIPEVIVERPVLTPADMQGYTGSFLEQNPEEEPAEVVTIQLEQDTLALYGPRMRIGPLVPETPLRFHVRATRLDVEFEAEDGRMQRLIFHVQGGKTYTYNRIS